MDEALAPTLGGMFGDRDRARLKAAQTTVTSFEGPIAEGGLGETFFVVVIGIDLPGAAADDLSRSRRFEQPADLADDVTASASINGPNPSGGGVALLTVRAIGYEGVSGGEAEKRLPDRAQAAAR